MARALLMPLAHSSTLNPCGTLMELIGISPGALGAGGWATGDSVELSSSLGCPCFHVGGAAGCAAASPVANTKAVTTRGASANRNVPGVIGGSSGAADGD